MPDILSVVVRSLSFLFLLQAAGIALFVALFGARLGEALERTRRVGKWSALAGILFVGGHYALEAARMSGELAGVFDPSMQAIVWGT
jgi:hypothetical protein